jgi:hypothetical protein
MPIDRTLSLTATPTLIWHGADNIGANMTYTQTGSVPSMPNVVNNHTGMIDLSRLPANADYTDNVDITITLDASGLRDPQGNPVRAQWANVGDPQTTGGNWNGVPPMTPWAWFCANPPPNASTYVTTPVLIPNMVSIRNSDTVVSIDDNTPINSGSYIFCLGLVLLRPNGARYFITIDPVIGGKGVGHK